MINLGKCQKIYSILQDFLRRNKEIIGISY